MKSAPGPLPFLAIAVLLTASACATAEPLDRALSRSQQTVATGVQRGLQASDQADHLRIAVRYNPCRCDAPDFELRIRGQWRRHLLNGDDELLQELNALALASLDESNPLQTWYLTGRVRGTRRHTNGAEYPIFRLEALFMEPASRASHP